MIALEVAVSKVLIDVATSAAVDVLSIRHGGDRACYSWRQDYISIPDKGLFTGTTTSTPTESYYAVLFHELTHWTGHETRLKRELAPQFKEDAYEMEELIASWARHSCALT